jgi:pimeloyl-ACP methyl ester carboxylesterase
VAAAYALCYYAGHRPSVAIERVAGRASAEVERHVSAIRPKAHRPDDQIVLVAHSHGGQVALLATGVLGLPVAGLVTVCTPVRRDVLDMVGNGVPRPWLHLHSDQADRWQWLGEWGDGAVGIVRRMPPPAINMPAAVGLGHSGLLTTAAGMRAWPSVVRAFEAEASS